MLNTAKKPKYECLKCHGTVIYDSEGPNNVLTCFFCGETEDSKYGISLNGEKVDWRKNLFCTLVPELPKIKEVPKPAMLAKKYDFYVIY